MDIEWLDTTHFSKINIILSKVKEEDSKKVALQTISCECTVVSLQVIYKPFKSACAKKSEEAKLRISFKVDWE